MNPLLYSSLGTPLVNQGRDTSNFMRPGLIDNAQTTGDNKLHAPDQAQQLSHRFQPLRRLEYGRP
jgi:hypothetical protein